MVGTTGHTTIHGWDHWSYNNTWLGPLVIQQYMVGTTGRTTIHGWDHWSYNSTWLGPLVIQQYMVGTTGHTTIQLGTLTQQSVKWDECQKEDKVKGNH